MNNDIVFTPTTLRALKMELLNVIDRIDKAVEFVGESAETDLSALPQKERAEHVMGGACRFFGDRIEDVRKRVNTGAVVAHKRYIAKLLYDYALLRHEDIAEYVGLSRSGVTNSILKLNDQLSDRMFGDPRVNTIWAILLAYLKLDKIPSLCA